MQIWIRVRALAGIGVAKLPHGVAVIRLVSQSFECGGDLADYGANPAGQKVLACGSCLWTNNGHRLGEEPDNWTA